MMAPLSVARLPDIEFAGPDAVRQLQIGLKHYAAGRIKEAIEAYQRGLASVESEPPGTISVETVSGLHSNLGNACMVRGDLGAAAESYKAALRLAPHLTSCWCNLGNVHLKTGKPQES
ncbi:MAG: hypothetical protein QOJ54_795, partial [Aliidongia sp.]|nr:hypothetical protein [Aliidongia sp.]